MNIFGNIDVMARAMDFHMDRQNVISANIANVDTPGYAPKEILRPEPAGESGFSLDLTSSDPEHFSSSGSSEGEGEDWEVVEQRDAVPGNDGNYVSLEREMSKLGANTIRYEAVAKLVSKHIGTLLYAARDGR